MNYDPTAEQPAEITVMAAEEMMRISYNLLKTAAGGNIAIGPILLGAAHR